jgi:hypothetical protein
MASSFVYFLAAVGICVLILRVTSPTYIEEEDELDWEIPDFINFPSSVQQLDLNDMLREIIDSRLCIAGFRGKKADELSNDLMLASMTYALGCVRRATEEQH